ncbi:hypothetical protein, partial [Faecalicatena contorta]|uniref:hypothetical protein n=1 Tax=Faecalicatena contorta TaxID=39482 RepID=UPI003217FC03
YFMSGFIHSIYLHLKKLVSFLHFFKCAIKLIRKKGGWFDVYVHILLLNNSGAAEFYYNKTWIDKDSDRHTSARHSIKAEGWVRENGMSYLSCRNKEEFDAKLKQFIEGEGPIVFEVFTEMSSDAQTIYKIYDNSRPISAKGEATKKLKSFVKEKVGQEKAKKILNILRNN